MVFRLNMLVVVVRMMKRCFDEDDFPMGPIVLGGSCPTRRSNCPQGELSYRGNGPRALLSWRVIIRGVVALVGSCPSG